ncbi:methyltransferase domain-containing protein [Mesorhizobium sp. STM 4661]|uniref:class I SAM-dependent methyltransferase n=1 Tax=Mesorhizobium sp. STM 4661 TaxID=1297570 RepID=UPI0002BEABE2|nr:methyltransferase domain-containing protein [Mesorhizobium sp. STM 4661]CCV15322.1 Methyltransferase type 12 [Mesorhizobium sp. STM 4661]
MSDTVSFFRAWMSNPLRVASIVPSGQALAEGITREIGFDQAPVIELGPGTGVFTRQLMENGVPEDRLVLIEYGANFATLLRNRFPKSTVLQADAAAALSQQFKVGKAGAVVSGLPILSMPTRQAFAILDGAFRNLRPGGAFYQFTYSLRCPVSRYVLDQLDLKAQRISWVLANVPPAQIYRFTKRRPRSAEQV